MHAEREVELAKKIGVKTVPYLVMLLDGHPYHYTEPSVSMVSSLGESLPEGGNDSVGLAKKRASLT